jgi:hypothetical protein
MATVSLNLERHVRASWSLTRAGGPKDNVKLVIADAICPTKGTGDIGTLLLVWFVTASRRVWTRLLLSGALLPKKGYIEISLTSIKDESKT